MWHSGTLAQPYKLGVLLERTSSLNPCKVRAHRYHRLVSISLMATTLDQDTLSLIFIAAYDFNPNFATTSSLRAVNSSWMALADNTPRLWTNLLFKKRTHFENVERVRLHIQNSKNYLLNVAISWHQLPKIFFSIPEETMRAIIALLREHVHRFRSFKISAIAHEFIEALVVIGDERAAPFLEELIIEVDPLRYSQYPR